jgi:hypothetical protein
MARPSRRSCPATVFAMWRLVVLSPRPSYRAMRPGTSIFTPATDRDNLDCFSLALSELDAQIRTDAVADGLPFSHSGESLGKASM